MMKLYLVGMIVTFLFATVTIDYSLNSYLYVSTLVQGFFFCTGFYLVGFVLKMAEKNKPKSVVVDEFVLIDAYDTKEYLNIEL